jgi:hypothetical protein
MDYSSKEIKKKNCKIPYTLITIAIILIALGLSGKVIDYEYIVPKPTAKNEYQNTYYFFYNANETGKYALYNENGKKITENLYDEFGQIINDTAYIKQDDKYGIIDIYGKNLVELGKYKSIERVGFFYKVTDSNDKTYLIDSDEKIIYDKENSEINKGLYYNYYYITDKTNNTYTYYNYKGEEIVSLPIYENVEKPFASYESDYIGIYYNNMIYMYNVETKKEVTKFDIDKYVYISYVNKEYEAIFLNATWIDKTARFVYEGKYYNLDDKCDKIIPTTGSILCQSNDRHSTVYMLDENFNLTFKIENTLFMSNSTYATTSTENKNSVDFYSDGKLVKTVDCLEVSSTGEYTKDLYRIKSVKNDSCPNSDEKYKFYTTSGDVAFDKSFTDVTKFDDNGLAIVSEDGTNYYLINKQGEKVSKEYTKITASDTSKFYVTVLDEKYGALDSTGKVLFKNEYKSISYKEINTNSDTFIALQKEEGEYILYNMRNHRKNKYKADDVKTTEHYIYTKKDDVKYCYTYNGVLLK